MGRVPHTNPLPLQPQRLSPKITELLNGEAPKRKGLPTVRNPNGVTPVNKTG